MVNGRLSPTGVHPPPHAAFELLGVLECGPVHRRSPLGPGVDIDQQPPHRGGRASTWRSTRRSPIAMRPNATPHRVARDEHDGGATARIPATVCRGRDRATSHHRLPRAACLRNRGRTRHRHHRGDAGHRGARGHRGCGSPRGDYVRAFGVADTATGAPMQTDFYSRIGSETKTFTITAVLQLADQRRIGLDDAIGRYLDGVPGGDAITVRQLAGMRSGLANYTETQGFRDAITADPYREYSPPNCWVSRSPSRRSFRPARACSTRTPTPSCWVCWSRRSAAYGWATISVRTYWRHYGCRTPVFRPARSSPPRMPRATPS